MPSGGGPSPLEGSIKALVQAVTLIYTPSTGYLARSEGLDALGVWIEIALRTQHMWAGEGEGFRTSGLRTGSLMSAATSWRCCLSGSLHAQCLCSVLHCGPRHILLSKRQCSELQTNPVGLPGLALDYAIQH